MTTHTHSGPIREMHASEVRALLDAGEIILIDVREPAEYAAERIHGALPYPLSTLDPRALPDERKHRVVLHCGSGKRSAMAAQKCIDAGRESMRTCPAASAPGKQRACRSSVSIPQPAAWLKRPRELR